ncbi:uncharacterized protein LOC113226402 [Hyposmocoma kahamanoa]|uniref:uncharacterized protein LOC113226402 n=1 Tax=Hyposmocoma kahamanoa TaxID=1477025 RepID=UPI000E6D8D56|nr:uncharacterized protein LOC113226402 [Hyposmocoma kahamanoa]
MHRFVVLVAFGVASVLTIKEECFKLANPVTMSCCKAPPPRPSKDESIKECFEKFGKTRKPTAETACELELCIGKKQGYIADDGTINKKALEADVAEKFKQSPDLVENITKHCINADVDEYGSEDFCELMKTSHCIHVQIAMACPEYDDRGHCSEIKSLAEKCSAE